MNQITIKWRVSAHMTAGDFRKRLRAVNGMELPRLLFWHDESGETIRCGHTRTVESNGEETSEKRKRVDNSARKRGPRSEESLKDESRVDDDAMPTIRFFHTKSFVGIHFVGPEMIEFASKNIPLIIDSVEQAIGNKEIKVLSYTVDLRPRLIPKMWFIPSLALKNPTFEFLSVEKYCERIISQDIRRQAKILGLEVPDNFYVRIASIGDKGTHWVRSGSGPKTGGALRLKDVKFLTNVDLKGCWAAGALISKGFGAILDPAAPSGGPRVDNAEGNFDE